MLRLRLAPEPMGDPFDFHAEVRTTGYEAIYELCGRAIRARPGRKRDKIADRPRDVPTAKLPPVWRECLDAMYDAYQGHCSYLGIRIERSTGARTVDHFLAQSNHHPMLAYEWCNYRLACSQINTLKGTRKDLLDPLRIGEDWFFLNFADYTVYPNPERDSDTRERVEATCQLLNTSPFPKTRRELAEKYLRPPPGRPPRPFWDVQQESPFIAREIEREGRRRLDDPEELEPARGAGMEEGPAVTPTIVAVMARVLYELVVAEQAPSAVKPPALGEDP